jgi:Fur family ferric uptake transcriptional regulator
VTGAGVRSTRQRAAITSLLEALDDFRSAQEIHDELRRRGEAIGLTTVYRTLQSMAAAGAVDTLRADTGESVYRRCSTHHHHHLVCRTCGLTVEAGRSSGSLGSGSRFGPWLFGGKPHDRDLRRVCRLRR